MNAAKSVQDFFVGLRTRLKVRGLRAPHPRCEDAAKGLIETRDLRAIHLLIARLPVAEWKERNLAIRVLAHLNARIAIPAIIDTINDSLSYSDAVEALSKLQATEDELLRAFSKGARLKCWQRGRGRDTRAESCCVDAISSLARLRDPRALEVLIEAIKDNDSRDKSRAASDALLELPISRERVAEAYMEILEESKSTSLLERVALELGKLKHGPAIQPLLRLLSENKDVGVAIGLLGDICAVEPMIELLKSDSRNVNLMQGVVEGLALLGDKRAVPVLCDVLKCITTDLWGIVPALGKLGDRRAIRPLRRKLKEVSGSFGYDIQLDGEISKALKVLEG